MAQHCVFYVGLWAPSFLFVLSCNNFAFCPLLHSLLSPFSTATEVSLATYLQERKYCQQFELEIAKMEEASDLPMNLLIGAGCATLVLGSGLAFVMMKSKKSNEESSIEEKEEQTDVLDPEVSAGTYINFI